MAYTLAQMLANRGYPTAVTPVVGTNGLNLTTLGYPSSVDPYTAGNVSTTRVNLPSTTTTRSSYPSYSRTARSAAGGSAGGDTAAADTSAYEEYIRRLEEEINGYKTSSEDKQKDREHDSEERQKDREQRDKERKEDREQRDKERKEDRQYQEEDRKADQEYNDKIRGEDRAEREEQRKKEEAEKQKKADAIRKLIDDYKKGKINRDEFRDKLNETAKKGYDEGKATVDSNYKNQVDALLKNLDSTKAQLTENYNRSQKNLNEDAENSLRQAYINNMLSQRNINQRLSAMGINGGATESTLLNMNNEYGNRRNDINTTLNRSLADLAGTYNNNIAAALRDYNTGVASAQNAQANAMLDLSGKLYDNYMQAERDRQGYLTQDQSDYYALLRDAAEYGVTPFTTPTTTPTNTPTNKQPKIPTSISYPNPIKEKTAAGVIEHVNPKDMWKYTDGPIQTPNQSSTKKDKNSFSVAYR